MKGAIFDEFSHAKFLVDLTREGAPLQANGRDVQNVLRRLRDHHNLTHTTLLGEGHSTQAIPRFPSEGFTREDSSYVPLTHFLNTILFAAQMCLTPWAGRYLSNLSFVPYGKEIKGTIDSVHPLKPDVLGLTHSLTSHTPRASWKDVAIIIEVKHREEETIQQLMTYARCYLAADRRRSFAIAITFDHSTFKFRFLVFHRSGVSASHGLYVYTETGFEGIVSHMVGILSIQDEKNFGLDLTSSGTTYRINNSCYEIVRPIYIRNSVRGRATVVYSLKGTKLPFGSDS